MRLGGALGCGDEEHEGGGSVLGPPVDAVGAAEREGGLRDGRAARVGDRDAAGQARRHRLLALADVGEEAVEIGAATRRDQGLGERPRRGVPILRGEVEHDLLLVDE
ncbi:hypothetical protein Lsed01_00513 [Demequina sediminis]|uniref:Uncharacterized protein n=1 Tax=Demequina sediminis TaxID=1930058 RepID=A0ABP9WG49_9MICO|nr:hypothetical protein GCM10025873_16640 [Demequina sediminis]